MTLFKKVIKAILVTYSTIILMFLGLIVMANVLIWTVS